MPRLRILPMAAALVACLCLIFAAQRAQTTHEKALGLATRSRGLAVPQSALAVRPRVVPGVRGVPSRDGMAGKRAAVVTRATFEGFVINQLLTNPQAQAALGAASAALLGGIGLLVNRGSRADPSVPGSDGAAAASPARGPTRGGPGWLPWGSAPVALADAVGVFGATGKTGSEVVKSLLAEGKSVIGYVRDQAKAKETFKDAVNVKNLAFRQCDVTKPDTLGDSATLFEGVSQLVIALGPVYGKLPSGEFGPIDGLTPQAVDYEGVINVLNSAKTAMKPNTPTTDKLFNWGWVPDQADLWTNFDDVIMGGTSASKVESVGGSMKWSGKVIAEGGGFCGMRSDPEKPIKSLQPYDALKMRIRGDGNRYKFTIQLRNGTRYQCPFDTTKGILQDIELPFSSFVGLSSKKANEVDYHAIPLSEADRSDIAFMNVVLSKFEFNGFPNRAGIPGEFSLSIDSIDAVAKPAPQIVMVTSAAVERNARITTKEQRQADIPIVQLNPQGILNWKYKGEAALRDSGLTYSVIRPCGLTTLNETTEFALDLLQGDRVSGAISRKEIASLVTSALSTPTADGKTFEVRRSEARDAVAVGAASRSVILQKLQTLVKDTDRYKTGLPVLPMAVDPPAEELSKEETQKVLDDPRVKAQRKREPTATQVAGRADDEPSFVVYRNGKPIPA